MKPDHTKKLTKVIATSSDKRISIHLTFSDGEKYVSHELLIDDFIGDTPTEFSATILKLADELKAKGDY